MKKFGVFLVALSLTTVMPAQDETKDKQSITSLMAEKGILNHMDIGVNVGTLGIGIDVAMPVGDYVRIRAGYNYMPRITLHSNFNIETSNGSYSNLLSKVDKINDKLAEYNIDLNTPGYEEYKKMYDKFSKVEKRDYVTMGLKPNVHQFKFLVDVLPFKNNKHWSFTAGFFVGPSDVGDACNLEKETLILEGINAYNSIYKDYPQNGINGAFLRPRDQAQDDPFYRTGLAGFKLGTFDDGEMAMMVPDKNATVRAEMEVNKFRPYLGFGYNTHLSKDKKWNMNVDAGILFLCGAPSIYVDNVYKIDASKIRFDEEGWYKGGMGFDTDNNYYGDIVRWNQVEWRYDPCGELRNHVDMVHDLHDIPGKVGNMVHTASKFKVYPNASVTFSYRLF
jgi:hypothetical protein